ncbi:hypothetical protein GVAMD_0537 [Gardnerella vaginalis AMD]|nr:hypothetical protein GVAMD_0537 [Gardnerella vaginalis AMD]
MELCADKHTKDTTASRLISEHTICFTTALLTIVFFEFIELFDLKPNDLNKLDEHEFTCIAKLRTNPCLLFFIVKNSSSVHSMQQI